MSGPSRHVLYVGSFVIDVGRCVLLRGDTEIPLRRKAFDVLRYLAERPGRLVSKDELIQQIWPGVHVTDDSLVQCISEVRQALADREHRLIKTAPRRGYILTAEADIGACPARSPSIPQGRGPDVGIYGSIPGIMRTRGALTASAVLLIALVLISVSFIVGQTNSLLPATFSQLAELSHRSAALEPRKRGVPGTEDVSSPERRVALVIGNGAYLGGGSLVNAPRDAEAVATAFRRAGFADVKLEINVTRAKFYELLSGFASLANEADWAVIYFAGRGIELEGTSYLVPIDARMITDRNYRSETITLDQLLRATSDARKLRLIILDACRDDPNAPHGVRSTGYTPSIDQVLADAAPSGATLIAYAAKHGQRAEDGPGKNGPFAHALVESLNMPGLELSTVFRRVRDQVLASTGRRQEPFIYGSLPAEPLYFVRP